VLVLIGREVELGRVERAVEHYARTVDGHRIAPAILRRLRGMVTGDEAPFQAAFDQPGRAPFELARTQLAQLVAQGLTNREAAAALFVSAKTVEHHLRSVFRKLGVKRRAEPARLMAAR
jgi:DNA-binding NarL/FixJ family response regulator